MTHKFRVGEQEGYVTVGLYDDGAPGEIFVNISKEGSTIRGLMDSVAVMTSVALQYGVPLENLVGKFRGVHFEPAGLTNNRRLPTASSLVDYIFRWLELRFLESTPPRHAPTAEKRRRRTPASAAAPAPVAGKSSLPDPTSNIQHPTSRYSPSPASNEHRHRLPRMRLNPRVRRGLFHLPELRL